ncbi:MAG: GerMN domain-containing protein [Tumebacillaceae bacterium]
MRSKKKFALLGVLAMSIVAATGCSALNTDNTSSPSDPSQGAKQENMANVMPTTVYVADSNGFVVPLNINVTQTKNVANTTLEHMIQGGTGDAALVGTGLKNILPKGTKVRGISINNGTAKVDFTKEVLNYKTAQEEHEIVDAIVWAMTGVPNVKNVQIAVDGHIQPTLKMGTPVGMTLSRENGINLQLAENANPSNSTKLTLYFEGASNSGDFTYLVPVTRVIPKVKDSNMVELTMSELAKGPDADGLGPVLEPTLKVNKADVKDKVATLDLADNFKLSGTQAEKDMVNSIVLSVGANAGVDKVQFTVAGKAPAATTAAKSGVDLTKPVNLPKVINNQKL